MAESGSSPHVACSEYCASCLNDGLARPAEGTVGVFECTARLENTREQKWAPRDKHTTFVSAGVTLINKSVVMSMSV